MWAKMRKIASPRNILISMFFLAIFSIFYMLLEWKTKSVTTTRRLEPPDFPRAKQCPLSRLTDKFNKSSKYPENPQTRQKALLFLRQSRTQLGRDIVMALDASRFKFHAPSGDIRNLPVLIDGNKGRYAVIIFEDLFSYTRLNQWNRDMLDKYCRDFNVGIVLFLHQSNKAFGNQGSLVNQVGDFPLKYATNVKMKDYELNPSSPILRIARPGEIVKGIVTSPNAWTVFELDHPTYLPVSYAKVLPANEIPPEPARKDKHLKKAKKFRLRRDSPLIADGSRLQTALLTESGTTEKLVTVVQDQGKLDGVQRVIIGGTLKFWLHKVLFLDALAHMSNGRLSLPLERHVQIDIDDIFVGVPGVRMSSDDVMELVRFQDELRSTIPDFTFQLGFSGKFIFSGNEEETAADRLFLKLHDRFSWFPHMWSHMQGHWFTNVTHLCEYMDINRQFSVRHHLNMSQGYAVAPHHAGVYPVHGPLYECWHRVWNITCTSTEEYPHLRPDYKRRGFVHDRIMVLPRQTCGLFTHTIKLPKYPGGPEVLDASINGGSLFQSFLFNQFNIFMTHLSNYGNDRLAIYTFDRAIKFVQCWTNLRLVYEPPHVVARKYFEVFPDEKEVVWTNPCNDKRHLEIWSEKKSCDRLPNFVVVGPQKTGTTALYWYLTMHPDVQSNLPSKTTFEEVQFFSSNNYLKGIDWYMDYFPEPDNGTILFEKSATYFDQQVVPKRIWSLLPRSKIVVIVIDPGKRAYSWYQHMRSHADPTALKHSFYDVIRAGRKTSPPALISLQRRCLDPGFYADNLERWLDFYDSNQLVLLDGEMLRDRPVQAMDYVQKVLQFPKKMRYDKLLRFDEKKGFFCRVLSKNKVKCLGKSKGRQYSEMDGKSRQFLAKYYREANVKLLRLLQSSNLPVPSWLQDKHDS